MVVFNAYFFHILGVKTAKLLMTIHDEVRYMAHEDEEVKVTYALQLGHLYTRALFIDAFDLDGIPQSCAHFSGVDVDTVWRKEADWSTDKDGNRKDGNNNACITPSQKIGIPPGKVLEPLDIYNSLGLQ